MSYWPVSLHPFCPLQFILYTSARGIFLQGKAMHSHAFTVKIDNLIMAHNAVKLCLCTILHPHLYLPSHSHAPSQFHSANHTGLSFPQAHAALLHISTFKSAGFLCLYLLPHPPPPPTPATNLPSQFLFILAVSAELALPQRHLLQSPKPSPNHPLSNCTVPITFYFCRIYHAFWLLCYLVVF